MDLRSIYTVILRYHNTFVFPNQCPRSLEDGEHTIYFLLIYIFILMIIYFKIR